MKSLLYLTIFFTFILPILSQAGPNETLSFLAEIDNHGHSMKITRSEDNQTIPSIILNKDLEQLAATLNPGDKVLVKGKVIYQPQSNLESKTTFSPIFVIESIQPITLKNLAETKKEISEQPNYSFLKSPKPYSPYGLPISTEVASAITITTSALLFESLTASPGAPQFKRDLGTGLIIFSGLLATGVFVYEQITSKKKVPQND